MKNHNLPAYKLSCTSADGVEFVVFATNICRAFAIARKHGGCNFTVTDFAVISPVINMTVYE